jgi:hypothetical protein
MLAALTAASGNLLPFGRHIAALEMADFGLQGCLLRGNDPFTGMDPSCFPSARLGRPKLATLAHKSEIPCIIKRFCWLSLLQVEVSSRQAFFAKSGDPSISSLACTAKMAIKNSRLPHASTVS